MKVLVVGGGIAGVSAGYYLAVEGHEVTLVEQESTLAHHSTGRSAALYHENYGALANRPLARASRRFFEQPPAHLADHPLISPRGAMWIARPDQMERLAQINADGIRSGLVSALLDPAELTARIPALRPEYLGGGVFEPESVDLDVAATHQAFVRGMRAQGAEVFTRSPVTELVRHQPSFRVLAGERVFTADVVINAAGAWCDVVGAMVGALPIGLQPMRRTAFMVPGNRAFAEWPLIADVDNEFYFRPDGTQLLCSLADETPVEPGDARPDPLDIALAIERINAATNLDIRSVRSSWAGLRSFVPDRAMVIGFDPVVPGFFWLAGQGGTGIQTAPAAGELTAGLVSRGAGPSTQLDLGVDPAALSPDRFRTDTALPDRPSPSSAGRRQSVP